MSKSIIATPLVSKWMGLSFNSLCRAWCPYKPVSHLHQHIRMVHPSKTAIVFPCYSSIRYMDNNKSTTPRYLNNNTFFRRNYHFLLYWLVHLRGRKPHLNLNGIYEEDIIWLQRVSFEYLIFNMTKMSFAILGLTSTTIHLYSIMSWHHRDGLVISYNSSFLVRLHCLLLWIYAMMKKRRMHSNGLVGIHVNFVEF